MTEANATPRRIRFRDRCRAFVVDRKGASAVEFAIVAAPFLALLFAIIQTFMVYFAQESLEAVVQESSRLILTGQVQAAKMTQSQFAAAVCSNVVIIFDCNKLMIDVQTAGSFTGANTGVPPLTFDGNGNVSNTWQYNPGNPGDIVVMRLMYQWPVFGGPLGFTLSNLANGNRLLMASAAFQNEP